MIRFTTGLLATLLVFSCALPAQSDEERAEMFQQRFEVAVARRDSAELRTLVPFLSSAEITVLLATRGNVLRTTARLLGPIGQGRLMYLRVEEPGESGQTLLEALCELRRVGEGAAAARRVSLKEAASAFHMAKHRSAMRVEAETGATQMLDEIEIEVLRPTRWIFFFLDPAREVRSVSIEADPSARRKGKRGSATEVFRVANFVALERPPVGPAWAKGSRVRIQVLSQLRLAPKRRA